MILIQSDRIPYLIHGQGGPSSGLRTTTTPVLARAWAALLLRRRRRRVGLGRDELLEGDPTPLEQRRLFPVREAFTILKLG